MGKRHRRAHHSSYRILMLHLLKWQFQPTRRSRSWMDSIRRERENISEQEDVSSDYRNITEREIATIYRHASRLPSQETRLPLSTFPDTCPYTTQELRDRDFLPE